MEEKIKTKLPSLTGKSTEDKRDILISAIKSLEEEIKTDNEVLKEKNKLLKEWNKKFEKMNSKLKEEEAKKHFESILKLCTPEEAKKLLNSMTATKESN